ncbi:MAG: hypothetical protein JOS17DRAFT_671351, partial [Linnemannia elongata]
GHSMSPGYILSTHLEVTNSCKQITGINSVVWAQSPDDGGGQIDSQGWPFHCAGYAKFVSLIEPSKNTFCI